jgi:hypothetical protein
MKVDISREAGEWYSNMVVEVGRGHIAKVIVT